MCHWGSGDGGGGGVKSINWLILFLIKQHANNTQNTISEPGNSFLSAEKYGTTLKL